MNRKTRSCLPNFSPWNYWKLMQWHFEHVLPFFSSIVFLKWFCLWQQKETVDQSPSLKSHSYKRKLEDWNWLLNWHIQFQITFTTVEESGTSSNIIYWQVGVSLNISAQSCSKERVVEVLLVDFFLWELKKTLKLVFSKKLFLGCNRETLRII